MIIFFHMMHMMMLSFVLCLFLQHYFCSFQFLVWQFFVLHYLSQLRYYLGLIHYFCYSHRYNNLVNIVLTRWSRFSFRDCLKTGPWPWTREKTDPLKNGPAGETEPQRLKTLSFVSCHMKDNVEVIHFHIQSRGVQGLAFVQITFEKCIRNFYFENGNASIKTSIVNL